MCYIPDFRRDVTKFLNKVCAIFENLLLFLSVELSNLLRLARVGIDVL